MPFSPIRFCLSPVCFPISFVFFYIYRHLSTLLSFIFLALSASLFPCLPVLTFSLLNFLSLCVSLWSPFCFRLLQSLSLVSFSISPCLLAPQPQTTSPYAPVEQHSTDILSRFWGFLAGRTIGNRYRSMHERTRVRVWMVHGTNGSLANCLNLHIPQYSGCRPKQNLD